MKRRLQVLAEENTSKSEALKRQESSPTDDNAMTSETEGKELLAASPTATEEFEFSINDDDDDDDEILISSSESQTVS